MKIYPAIDLYEGKCVRLYQGDYEKSTVYHTDPYEVIEEFRDAGSQWLHIVDLSGAKDQKKNQLSLIAEIALHFSLNIQTGGGIRTEAQIKKLLDKGIARVIVGSLAVREPEKVFSWLKHFGPERIVLAFDCKLGLDNKPYVMMHGWQEQSQLSVDHMLQLYAEKKIKHVLCTDISQDGTLEGPNFELYQTLLKAYPEIAFQASGGVRDMEDILKLRSLNMAGVVIGKAIYEKRLELSKVIYAS